ncbi:MAG: M20 family metallopeptidase [Acidobacteria bacterium]|nr:M20 family metallopeptidase [Acidobacteriota bacterium]MBI3425128.1 M20 family metallopeptidase [Acidobacteriota bacterium]
MLTHFTDRQSAILELTRLLVERETTSREEARLNEIASFVAALFQELGAIVEPFPQAGYGTHVRVRCGFGHAADAQHVLVIGHLDTVWPVGTLQRMPFRYTADGAAHGPGIFDMKSGIACLIEALRTIKTQGLATQRPLTILLTCDEEIGSRTSRSLVEAEAVHAAAALVLEPPIPGGIVKTGRKGIGVFSLRALGRAAHAGLDPSKGVNAIVELAQQTLQLAALNDYERGTTVNVGVFNGGTTTNVVPAEATASIDVRFWTQADGAYLENAIRSLKPILPEAQLEIGGGINRPPMPRSPQNLALFEHARGLAGELGFELKDGVVGGGSDGNFTAALGVPTLDGLGVDGAGAHADHEHIIVSDIPRRAALLTRLLQTV